MTNRHTRRALMQMKPSTENPITIQNIVNAAIAADRRLSEKRLVKFLIATDRKFEFSLMIARLQGIVLSKGKLWNDTGEGRIISPLVPNIAQLSQIWQNYINACEALMEITPHNTADLLQEMELYSPVIVKAREAINALYEGKDHGNMLRQALQPIWNPEAAPNTRNWLDAIKLSGATSKDVIANQWLIEVAASHKLQTGKTWLQVADYIIRQRLAGKFTDEQGHDIDALHDEIAYKSKSDWTQELADYLRKGNSRLKRKSGITGKMSQ